MPVHDLARPRRIPDFTCKIIRRIQTEVLPEAARCLDRSVASLDKSLALQFEAAVRLVKKIV